MPFPDALTKDGPVTGRVRAKVTMKKVKYSRVLDALELASSRNDATGGGAAFALTAPGGGEFDAKRFNRVMADYLDLTPGNPGLAGLELVLSSQNKGQDKNQDGTPIRFVSDPLAGVERLTLEQINREGESAPVAAAEWAEKDYLYLIRRMLGLSFDPTWRYAQDGPSTFLQRRFDKELIDVGAVDVVLRRNQKVQVNLVVGLDPKNPRSRTVLDWYKLPKRNFELDHGRSVLRIYIGRYLRENFPGAKSIILRELSLMFFKENTGEVLANRNVERIAFASSGLDPAETAANGLPRNLPADADLIFTGRKQLSVNISTLSKPEFADMRLVSAGLFIRPMEAGQAFVTRLESARLALVSPREDVPAYLAATDALCATFDGDCNPGEANQASNQEPLWQVVFPFETPRRPGFGNNATEGVRLFGTEGLFSADAPIRAARGETGLAISGRASAVEMIIPGDFAVAPGKAYSLWLELGQAGEDLSGVTFLADGYRAALKPNAATPLAGLPGRLANARIRFDFAGPEFSLTLRRAILSATATPGGRENVFAASLLMPQYANLDALPAETPGRGFDWLRFPLPAKNGGYAAIYLPGLEDQGKTLADVYAALPADGGHTAGKGEIELSGARLSTWTRVFGASPTAMVAGKTLAPGDITPKTAAAMAGEDAWIDLGQVEIAKDAGAVFADNPWFEAATLLFETDQPLAPGDLAQPAKPKVGVSGKLSLAVKAGLGLLSCLFAFVLGRVIPWRRLAGPAAVFLAAGDVNAARARREIWRWLGVSLALALAGLFFGVGGRRWSFVLAGLALIPVWRGLQAAPPQWLTRRIPALSAWFGRTLARRYFAGFATAAVLAAILRTASLLPVSEFVFTAGLYLLCIGLLLEFGGAGSPDKTPYANPRNT
jgi:hypothetical protein